MPITTEHSIVNGFIDGNCEFCDINPRDLSRNGFGDPPCNPHEEPTYENKPSGATQWHERNALEDEPEVSDRLDEGVRTASA